MLGESHPYPELVGADLALLVLGSALPFIKPQSASATCSSLTLSTVLICCVSKEVHSTAGGLSGNIRCKAFLCMCLWGPRLSSCLSPSALFATCLCVLCLCSLPPSWNAGKYIQFLSTEKVILCLKSELQQIPPLSRHIAA